MFCSLILCFICFLNLLKNTTPDRFWQDNCAIFFLKNLALEQRTIGQRVGFFLDVSEMHIDFANVFVKKINSYNSLESDQHIKIIPLILKMTEALNNFAFLQTLMDSVEWFLVIYSWKSCMKFNINIITLLLLCLYKITLVVWNINAAMSPITRLLFLCNTNHMFLVSVSCPAGKLWTIQYETCWELFPNKAL